VNHTVSDFKQRKTALLSRCAAAQSLSNAAQIHQHLKWLSDLCDETLKSLWQQAGIPPDFSLLAVGGYGRGAVVSFFCLGGSPPPIYPRLRCPEIVRGTGNLFFQQSG